MYGKQTAEAFHNVEEIFIVWFWLTGWKLISYMYCSNYSLSNLYFKLFTKSELLLEFVLSKITQLISLFSKINQGNGRKTSLMFSSSYF